MNITYGIIAAPDCNQTYLCNLVESIYHQYRYNDDDFEIIMVGGPPEIWKYNSDEFGMVKQIPFDETIKPGWITRKKNIVAEEAKFDNLCLMHDYFQLSMRWLDGVKKTILEFPDWNVMVNRVYTNEGYRSADWLVDPCYMEEICFLKPYIAEILKSVAPHENHPKYVSGLPYDVRNLTNIQYISGGFFMVKRDILLENPFNEHMKWGDSPGEDVDWSRKLSDNDIRFTWNDHSLVVIQKPNKWHCYKMPREVVDELISYFGED